MMSLTGMAGYCRAWLPDYAEVVQPLADLIYGHKMAMIDKIKWTPEGLTALTRLNQLMTTSPCLGLPDHSKPFNLFVCEKNGFMSGTWRKAAPSWVLFQTAGQCGQRSGLLFESCGCCH
jgi:hypothetical protein